MTLLSMSILYCGSVFHCQRVQPYYARSLLCNYALFRHVSWGIVILSIFGRKTHTSCSKNTSRSGPDSARQSRRRRCSVRSCDKLNRPGCRSSSHSRIVVAFSAPSTSLRRRGSTSSAHTRRTGPVGFATSACPSSPTAACLAATSAPSARSYQMLLPPLVDSCLPLASASVALPPDL